MLEMIVGRYGITLRDKLGMHTLHRFYNKKLTIKDYSRKDRDGNFITTNSYSDLVYINHGSLIRMPKDAMDFVIRELEIGAIHKATPITYKPDKVKYKLRKKYTPRDYQVEVSDKLYEADKKTPFKTHLLGLQTGRGKTFISLYLCTRFKHKGHTGRIVAIMRAAYLKQWKKAINDTLTINEDEILIVEGSPKLHKLLNRDYIKKYKAILISTTTLDIYHKKHINRVAGAHTPAELWQSLAAGTLLIDEVDELAHCNYRIISSEPIVGRIVGMSASLYNKSTIKNEVYAHMFPHERRYTIDLLKYIKYIIMEYRFPKIDADNIRVSHYGQSSYEHNAYEKWMGKTPSALKHFYRMMYDIIHNEFIVRYKEGESLLVYTKSIALAEDVFAQLTAKYSKDKLKVAIVTGELGTYEEFIDADIVVTTTGKSTRAFDKPGLITVLDTTITGNIQSNIQKIGRLRKRKGREVRYIQMLNVEIPKHKTMVNDAVGAVRDKVKEIVVYRYNNQ